MHDKRTDEQLADPEQTLSLLTHNAAIGCSC